jgi:hypothetical protein
MRTPHRATYVALLGLLAGCGTATSITVAEDPGSTPPPPAQSSSATRPLDDFPLARGYPETNGDDGSPVVVSRHPGLEQLILCGRPAWSPGMLSPIDLVGATYTGEAEDSRGITLVRYADIPLAAKAMAMVQVGVARCPEEADGARTYSGLGRQVGDEAFTITQRFRAEYGFDTGLVVYDFVRVSDLLLINWDYGEGGGSEATIASSQRAVTDQSDDLLPELCEYSSPAQPPRSGVAERGDQGNRQATGVRGQRGATPARTSESSRRDLMPSFV